MVFIDADSVQFRVAQLGRKALPDGDSQVLGCRNPRGKFWDFLIEEAVVHGVENLAVHNLFELLEINHKTGARVDFTFHGYFEYVVVTVPIGVIALSEELPVLLRGKIRIVVIVRRGEFSFAGQVEQAVEFPSETNLSF